MKVYTVVNDAGDILAWHEDVNVVENYISKVYKTSKVSLNVNKERVDVVNKLDDLYLARYGNTYIQIGYICYLSNLTENVIEDNRYARDIILRELERCDLTKKEKKTLSKAADILDRLVYEDSSYTPCLTELQRIKEEYDPYYYSYDLLYEKY